MKHFHQNCLFSIAILTALYLLFFPKIGMAQADPTVAPLLYQSDLVYRGSFKLPGGNFGMANGTFQYAGGFVGGNVYNDPVHGKTLFASGYLSAGYVSQTLSVAQVKIPLTLSDPNTVGDGGLATATVVQGFDDPSNGKQAQALGSSGNGFGNFVVYNGKLIGTTSAAYDATCGQTESAWVAPVNFSQKSQATGPYDFNSPVGPRWIGGGYMALVPAEWQSLLGGKIVSGNGPWSIISCGSPGPTLHILDADALANQPSASTTINSTPLVYYEDGIHSSLGVWNSNQCGQVINGKQVPCVTVTDPYGRGNFSFAYEDNAMRVMGVLFPEGSRSVLFFGSKGMGPYCYGEGSECGDSDRSGKGDHAYPYTEFIWAYDANDLLLVKNGQKNPWDVLPYAGWAFKVFSSGGGTNVGVSWDPETRSAYVVAACTTGECVPIVHVYQIGTPTPDTTPPTSPTSLSATSPSQSSISVSWNPATDNIGVTGYIIERCQGSGCSNFTQVGTPTSSPFLDSGLTANTFYNYHVRATDAAGNLSGWSNVVGTNTQLPDTQPPTVPTNLQASVISSSNITLTWTASTDNVAVTGYKLERCAGASCTTFSEIGTPTVTNYSDTGLSATTLYRYRVRATDAANNNSNYSTIAEGTTPQAPPTPTFVAEYETAWNSAISPKTTANFSVQSGDILVAYAVNEDAGNTLATPPAGTLTGAWTLRQSATTASYTGLRLWSMNVASNQSNVNVSFVNGGNNFGGNVLHFRNASSVGITAQASNNTGNPTLTLNGVSENSTIVMVNGDWSARTGSRTYNTTQAGAFTETSAYADGTSYGVEAGYYANAGAAGNKNVGLTAPAGMKWALAALEVKGNPTAQPVSCNTVTTSNFSQAAYNSYGAPFDAFQTSTNLMDAKCNSADTHTINLTTGVTGDTTRIVYTKGYWYDAVTTAWRQYTGTCTGALNGEWCQGSISATITDTNVSTASSANPTYLVGMTCSVQGGSWKCGCRDTSCANFSWQIQGAGL